MEVYIPQLGPGCYRHAFGAVAQGLVVERDVAVCSGRLPVSEQASRVMQAHNLEVAGSNPAPATTGTDIPDEGVSVFLFRLQFRSTYSGSTSRPRSC